MQRVRGPSTISRTLLWMIYKIVRCYGSGSSFVARFPGQACCSPDIPDGQPCDSCWELQCPHAAGAAVVAATTDVVPVL